MTKPPVVKDAYALNSAAAVKELYRDWAGSYDIGFSMSQGYQIPREVALAFFGAGGEGPVLDVGAGTGLVGEQIMALGDLIEADVLQPLPTMQRYQGIVSAGTFTLGHVGPKGVIALLDIAEKGALFVISVNAAHFESAGFAAMLDNIGDRITDLSFKDIRIYDDRASEDHRDDTARLILFRTR